MQVIKFSGDKETFNPRKIFASIKDAGGSTKIAKETVTLVRKKFHPDITTKEILKIVLENLKKEPGVSERYNLKGAIMSLGPTGFPFEEFFAKLLQHYGYQTKTKNNLKGRIIHHEVDIVAEKGKKFMIECKYHNESGTLTRLHPAMYTYARFLDLERHKFDKAWLVTNTRCTLDARQYARGVGLKITSWKYPEKESLQKLVEKKNLYPITVLNCLTKEMKEKLFSIDIVMLKDFEKFAPEEIKVKTKFTDKQIEEILKEVYEILI